MQTLLPDGFISLAEAISRFETMLFAGVPERQPVLRTRRALGPQIGDGFSSKIAKDEVWAAVDEGLLQLFAIGGVPRQTIRLDAALTQEVPLLRNVGSLVYLRHSHRHWKQFTAWFGLDLADVALAFREVEVTGAIGRLRRRSRRKRPVKVGTGLAGRPSMQAEVKQAIIKVVERGPWNSHASNKELTNRVNRLLKRPNDVSEATVSRALKQLHMETGDRRFARRVPAK